jgi:hypothetical protein
MALFIVASLVGILLISAVWDFVERGRRPRRRSSARMAAVRRDMLADAWSTQHRGIPTPIGHMTKDPGTPED